MNRRFLTSLLHRGSTVVLAVLLLAVVVFAVGIKVRSNDTGEQAADGSAVQAQTGSAAAVPAEPNEENSEAQLPVLAEQLTLTCSSSSNKVSVGNQITVSASVLPQDTSNQVVTYTSSDPKTASITQDGLVEGKKLGKVTITAETTDGSKLSEKIELYVRLAQPKDVTAECTDAVKPSVQITWSKVENAKGYSVYRQADGGDWEKLTDKMITEQKFTDQNPVYEQDNAYAVIAIAEQDPYNSKRSESAVLKFPDTPYGTKISAISDNGIEVYWKKPSGATGYEVFRSNSEDGDYKKIADISSRQTYTYVDKEFDHGLENIYYQVRSYSLAANGQPVYSQLSESACAQYRRDLSLEIDRIFLRSGESRTLTAYYGWGTADHAQWSSSDTAVADVNAEGTITGVKSGTCEISCYSKDTDQTQTCTVVVDRQPLHALSAILTEYVYDRPNETWKNLEAQADNDAVIMMVGDMMCTGTQQAVQGYDTGDYYFNNSFDGVKSLISSADFAVGNLETTLSSTWPYMHEEAYIDNYANCNAPSRYLDAVRYAGFDGVMLANNHDCDAGVQGALETLQQVDRYHLAATGEFADESQQRYLLADVDGIQVGYLSYVSRETGFNGKDEQWDSGDVDTMLNYYDPDKAQQDIQALREAGAEYVIVYMHWGVKNISQVTQSQSEIAQQLADRGADYIVGSHCHLIQTYTELTSSEGKTVPCFYSLGDFQASITQIPGNRDSVILRIRLARAEDGSVVLEENNYIACYTLTEYEGKPYYTIPLDQQWNGGFECKEDPEAYDRIVSAVGSQIGEYEGS